jgi:hypothetical protein
MQLCSEFICDLENFLPLLQYGEAQFSRRFQQEGSAFHWEQCLSQEQAITVEKGEGSWGGLVEYCYFRVSYLAGHSRSGE